MNLNYRIWEVFEIANVFEFFIFTLIITSVGRDGKLVFHQTFLTISSNIPPETKGFSEKPIPILYFMSPLFRC